MTYNSQSDHLPKIVSLKNLVSKLECEFQIYQDNAGLCLWTHGLIWLDYLLEWFDLVWLITTLIIFGHHYWSK